MELYALRFKNSGELARLAVSGLDTCGGYSADLCKYSNTVWTTTSRETAERVSSKGVHWFDSSVESPENPYVGTEDALEVVTLQVIDS